MKDAKCYIVCYPNSKIPIGEKWDALPLSAAEIDQRRANYPAINVGLLLGPVSGLIDVECDGEEATAAYAKLLGSILTPSWHRPVEGTTSTSMTSGWWALPTRSTTKGWSSESVTARRPNPSALPRSWMASNGNGSSRWTSVNPPNFRSRSSRPS